MSMQVEISRPPQMATHQPAGRVAELVDGLTSPSPDQRQAAVRALVEMGPSVESQVRWVWLHPGLIPTLRGIPEFWQRRGELPLSPPYPRAELEEILSRLEEQRQLQPSLITLHYTNALLTNVLAELGRQAGVAVSVQGFYSLDWAWTNLVSVDVTRATYWQALAGIEKSAEVEEEPNVVNELVLAKDVPDPARVNSAQQPHPSLFAVSGPLKISLESTELAHLLNYVDGKESARAKLTLYARAEPKLWNAGAQALVQLEECADDQGHSLLSEGTNVFHSVNRVDWYWEVPVEVAAPPPGGQIKTLKGRFSVELRMEQLYLCLTNLMRAEGQFLELGDLRVSVAQVRDEPEVKTIRLEISAPAGSPATWTFGNDPDSCYCNVSILDESGPDIFLASGGAVLGYGRSGMAAAPQAVRDSRGVEREAGRDVLTWDLYFSKPLRPASLVWLTPSGGTRWFTVPFELHNLPTPPK